MTAARRARAKRRRHPATPALALIAAAIATGRPARADLPRDTPTAIEVDRDTAPGGRVGFGFDGGEPVDAWGASIALGWIEAPITLARGAFGNASLRTQPVRRRETLALGGAVAAGDRIVLDGVLRVSHQVGDRLHEAGNPDDLARFVMHDLQLGGRIQIVGDRERSALLRGELTLPTGDDAQFAGDAAWTAAWSLIGRVTLPRDFVVAATAGIRLHGAEVAVGDQLIGDALFAALGASVPLSVAAPIGPWAEHVALTASLLGALGDHVGKLSGPSPLEARIGAIVRPLPDLTIGGQVGFGLDDQIGAPRFRALIEVAWTPRVERPEPAPSTAPPVDDDPDEP